MRREKLYDSFVESMYFLKTGRMKIFKVVSLALYFSTLMLKFQAV